jgi:hypothetical protein
MTRLAQVARCNVSARFDLNRRVRISRVTLHAIAR